MVLTVGLKQLAAISIPSSVIAKWGELGRVASVNVTYLALPLVIATSCGYPLVLHLCVRVEKFLPSLVRGAISSRLSSGCGDHTIVPDKTFVSTRVKLTFRDAYSQSENKNVGMWVRTIMRMLVFVDSLVSEGILPVWVKWVTAILRIVSGASSLPIIKVVFNRRVKQRPALASFGCGCLHQYGV